MQIGHEVSAGFKSKIPSRTNISQIGGPIDTQPHEGHSDAILTNHTKKVAQLIHSRMRAIGCDINKTKKTENDLLSNFDEQRDHRTEQLSIDRHNNEVKY